MSNSQLEVIPLPPLKRYFATSGNIRGGHVLLAFMDREQGWC